MKRSRAERGEEEEGGDEDQEFLDRVLNKLYDFGDGSKGNRSKKKDKTRKRVPDEDDETAEEFGDSEDKISSIKDAADLNHTNGANHPDSTSKSPAIASDVEIVTFQDPLKKNKLKRPAELDSKPPQVQDKKKKNPDEELTIEKARLEVHRFGITGFQKHQQRIFEQDRAIMLGARPPKKEYVNYKVYQQMIKEKKLKEKEETNPDTMGTKKKSGKSGKQKTEKRKPSSSGGDPAGQVGRFKNGMLVLSNKDIQKINTKVKKR
ncbi:hypothetical protein AMEX_G1033 [Astyanax mexicanus]|uniref:Zgc:194224 n=1 Tax=Astyanax mexicanus TaxID=7994 RepID=A0A8B9HW76_ASTMX|nr:hypothetical protein AMEX_G1033 [Astyanax mexicanus]